MASILARGIRPSLHAIIFWLVLAALAFVSVPGLVSTFTDFRQAQAQRTQYQSDCAGVPNGPGAQQGPCYVAQAMVSYDIGGMNTGDNTLYADVTGLTLNSTRIPVQGNYNPYQLPAGGHQVSIQVWRGRATKILMGSKWQETEDNPFTHTGVLQVLLLGLGTFAAWVATILLTVLLIKGFITTRKDTAPAADDSLDRPGKSE